MALNIDDFGTIFIHQGDSGEVFVQGIATDKDYRVYFAIHDHNRKLIGNELVVNSNYQDTVKFTLSSDLTDLLSVPDDECYALYHYGLKVCSDNVEDTLFVSGAEIGHLNNIIVYPKLVEGSYV